MLVTPGSERVNLVVKTKVRGEGDLKEMGGLITFFL